MFCTSTWIIESVLVIRVTIFSFSSGEVEDKELFVTFQMQGAELGLGMCIYSRKVNGFTVRGNQQGISAITNKARQYDRPSMVIKLITLSRKFHNKRL